ncbi:hypothetical protein JBE27_10585 [Streptomyces albiflaviniger]|nr:hypothetical protein [Streptomyces albiflaviniger]
MALLTAAKAHATLPEPFDGCGLPYVILPGSDSNPKAEPVFAKDRAPECVLVTPQLAATKAQLTEFPAGSPMVRSSFQTGLDGGKRLHLVVTARTGHADLLKLVRASEPVMMTTGNRGRGRSPRDRPDRGGQPRL